MLSRRTIAAVIILAAVAGWVLLFLEARPRPVPQEGPRGASLEAVIVAKGDTAARQRAGVARLTKAAADARDTAAVRRTAARLSDSAQRRDSVRHAEVAARVTVVSDSELAIAAPDSADHRAIYRAPGESSGAPAPVDGPRVIPVPPEVIQVLRSYEARVFGLEKAIVAYRSASLADSASAAAERERADSLAALAETERARADSAVALAALRKDDNTELRRELGRRHLYASVGKGVVYVATGYGLYRLGKAVLRGAVRGVRIP